MTDAEREVRAAMAKIVGALSWVPPDRFPTAEVRTVQEALGEVERLRGVEAAAEAIAVNVRDYGHADKSWWDALDAALARRTG